MTERVSFVRALRALARSHGLPQVRDTAGKENVKTMALSVLEALEAAGLNQEDAKGAWEGYRGTWPDWSDSSESEEVVEAAAPGRSKEGFAIVLLSFPMHFGKN